MVVEAKPDESVPGIPPTEPPSRAAQMTVSSPTGLLKASKTSTWSDESGVEPAARGVTGGFTAERLVLPDRIPKSFDHQRFVEDRDQLVDTLPVEVQERDADQVGKGLIGEANPVSVDDEEGFRRMRGGQLGWEIRLGAHGLGFTIGIGIEVPPPVDQRLWLSLLFS